AQRDDAWGSALANATRVIDALNFPGAEGAIVDREFVDEAREEKHGHAPRRGEANLKLVGVISDGLRRGSGESQRAIDIERLNLRDVIERVSHVMPRPQGGEPRIEEHVADPIGIAHEGVEGPVENSDFIRVERIPQLFADQKVDARGISKIEPPF